MAQEIHVEVEGGGPPRRSGGGGGGGFLMVLPGLFFIVLGVLVIVVPELITWMVACAFFLVGLGLLVAGMSVRRFRRSYSLFNQVPDDR